MRTVSSWGLVVALLGLATSCDTTQPAQQGARTAQVSVQAVGALIDAYDVWDVFEDSNGDFVPDDRTGDGVPDFSLWCEGPIGSGSATSLPWSFSLRISVIRAGTTTPEVLTNSASLVEGNNRSLYDSALLPGNVQPFPPSVGQARVSVGARVFGFTNARRMTIANTTLLASNSNFLHDADSALPKTEQSGYDGLCPKPDGFFNAGVLIPPTISGLTQPFEFSLGPGDTVVVEGRRFNTPPSGVTVFSQPAVAAGFALDGQQITNLQGTSSTTIQPDSGFSFSFSAR